MSPFGTPCPASTMVFPTIQYVFTRLPRRIALAVGLLLVALASVVIAGWFCRSAALVQVLPNAAPMRFNTALCLALLGASFIALSRGARWLPLILGTAVAVVALATVSQDLTGINLAIDNLLFDDWTSLGWPMRGRMAINTAICCIFAGISCASLSMPRLSRWQPLIECGCGALVLTIGAVSTFGYLSGLEAAYGWGGRVGMAVHTAAAMAVAGLTFMILAVGHQYEWSNKMPRWLPLPAIIIQMTATVAIAQAIYLEELKKADHVRQERVNCVARLMEQQLKFQRQTSEAQIDLPTLLAEVAPADLTKRYQLQVVSAADAAEMKRLQKGVRISEASIAADGLDLRLVLSQPWSLAKVLRRPVPIALIVRSLLMAAALGLAIYFAQRSLERSIVAEELAAELQRAKTRFRAIFDQTFQFIGLLSTDGTLLEVNRTALQFAGIAEEEVLGKPYWETPWWTHSPEQQEQLQDAIRRAAAGEVIRFEANHQGPDGQAIFVDFSLKPVLNEQGIVTLLIPEGHDITARLKAEASVRTSEQRLELAIRGSSDGIWDWNLTTGEAYYSPRYKQLLGYQEEEFPDDLAAFREHLCPHDAAAIWSAIEAHLERGEPYDATFRLLTTSGDWRWFRARGSAVRAPSGHAERMAGALTDVTDAVLAEQELTRRARLDKLTGLPNRLLLLERLQHLIDQAHEAGAPSYAVMFLDFDRFKLVNDSLGHDVGDALLQAIAQRLQNIVCPVDSVSRRARGNSVGRLGGDEFVVLLDDVRSKDDAPAMAERLLAAFAEPYQLGEHEVYSTASIGILCGDLYYDQASDALRDADVAMYEAKQRGKARYVVFDEPMRQVAQRHLQLEHDLRKAMASEQLSLVYEPLISFASGELVGVEAIVRWEHPTDGDIQPAEFLPIAEESDLIHTLGTWALSAACRQMRQWIDELGVFAPRTISLNVSRKQFARRDFADVIQRSLTGAGITADRLQIELCEDVLSGDVEQALQTMRQLHEQGIRFAMDNFCASNGSFAILHRLPIDILKVDRSLLEHIEHSKYPASLIHALAVLVRNLGIALVANGVNRQSQWLALQELGCSAAQGTFVSRRMNADAMQQFIIHHRGVALTTSGASAFANRLSETMSLEAL